MAGIEPNMDGFLPPTGPGPSGDQPEHGDGPSEHVGFEDPSPGSYDVGDTLTDTGGSYTAVIETVTPGPLGDVGTLVDPGLDLLLGGETTQLDPDLQAWLAAPAPADPTAAAGTLGALNLEHFADWLRGQLS